MTTVLAASNSLCTTSAVLFLIFNRPDTTARVFEAIRRARPARLYVAADGPRASRAGEAAACAETRDIITRIDWPCELHTLFRDQNLGCKAAVSGAISWFFDHEAEGIILEDDCLPSPSFFPYCDALLDKYRDDDRVGQVSGSRFFADEARLDGAASYVFSRYGSIWGWASWRRAWQHYDPDLRDWDRMTRPENLDAAFPDRRERMAKLAIGKQLKNGSLDTWDYQWGFTKAYQSQLSVVPSHNLIVNIGFGAEATHTKRHDSKAPQSLGGLSFPLIDPPYFTSHAQYDAVFAKRAYPPDWHRQARAFLARIARRLRKD